MNRCFTLLVATVASSCTLSLAFAPAAMRPVFQPDRLILTSTACILSRNKGILRMSEEKNVAEQEEIKPAAPVSGNYYDDEVSEIETYRKYLLCLDTPFLLDELRSHSDPFIPAGTHRLSPPRRLVFQML
jgi:hypothetical protein